MRPQPVSVTDQAYDRGNNYEHLKRYELERLHWFLNNEVRITLEQARDLARNRWKCWLVYLRGLAASSGVEIVPVSTASESIARLFLEYGFQRHMLSYYRLRTQRADVLQRYVASC